jgi:hypothetical protein
MRLCLYSIIRKTFHIYMNRITKHCNKHNSWDWISQCTLVWGGRAGGDCKHGSPRIWCHKNWSQLPNLTWLKIHSRKTRGVSILKYVPHQVSRREGGITKCKIGTNALLSKWFRVELDSTRTIQQVINSMTHVFQHMLLFPPQGPIKLNNSCIIFNSPCLLFGQFLIWVSPGISVLH